MADGEDEQEVRSLGARIPEAGFADDDEAMDAFLGWVADLGLSLYPAQEEAVLELFSDANVLLKTPTGSGKSMVAVAMHFRDLARARRSVYTAPIKALVSEKFFALCQTFGAENVGMMTGDGSINREAPIICCTAEILAKMAVQEGPRTPFASVVMDEFHYYGDRDRGMAWQLPLLTMSRARFLLMSATLGDTRQIEADLEQRTGASVAVVSSSKRPVPLRFEYRETPIHESIEQLVRANKAPLYIVHFSQREAAETAGAMMSINFASRDEKAAIKAELKGFRFDSPYGADMRRFVEHGVGLHHAGLLPKYRLMVERLAQKGMLKLICGTDTLGVGINVPIRAVLFTKLCKYDGEKVDILTVRDFKQIAGRAGRKGYDDEGFVYAQAPDWIIENKRLEEKARSGKSNKKKFVRKKPPQRGYKHWDEETFRRLISSPPEALESRFEVDHGLLLALLRKAEASDDEGADGIAELRDLIGASHTGARRTEELIERAEGMLGELVEAGVVDQLYDASGDVYLVSEELQDDFSLHHSLSLFLLHAIGRVSPDSEDYALDVVTMLEAVLESPRQVLHGQVSVAKGRLIAELKAAGVPYEERMEKLEEVTWPRPHAEWIYETFNEYADDHPWVQGEAIQPKSIVRDMVERYAAFADYVRELRLQRSEGVLLRYLTQAYKTLLQSVPAEAYDEKLWEIAAFLRAMLGRVDSSLITEWERLAAADEADGADPTALAPVDISADPRRFMGRVRAELQALVRALSRGDWEEAAGWLRDPQVEERPAWDAEAVEAAMAPFLDAHGGVAFDGRARQAWLTRIEPDGPHRWRVRQILVPQLTEADLYDDPEAGDEQEAGSAWSLEGVVDLRADTNPEGPLVELLTISE